MAVTDASAIGLYRFSPAHLPALVAFLNVAFAGHRHYAAITPADFAERVLVRPQFDAAGLILALDGERVAGAVHAIKPPLVATADWTAEVRHHIAWLAVDPAYRRHQIGHRLLGAAEDYLYYCPVYFAAQNAPFYGILERLWAPWYGSTERMGVSAVNDKELIAWLGKRGYHVTRPGDVAMSTALETHERPPDPGLAERGLRIVPVDEGSPWSGDEPGVQLRTWGSNGGRRYKGLVVADGNRAVGSVVWYPMPQPAIAALAWIGIERQYRGLRFGSYLLDLALAEMAQQGYVLVEVHTHTGESPEAYALFRRRGFQVIDYWVNLVKT